MGDVEVIPPSILLPASSPVTQTGNASAQLCSNIGSVLNVRSIGSAAAQPQTVTFEEQVTPEISDSIKPKKKKKNSKKPKSKRGLGKPTGFEEYYGDAPMTPAEHEAEQVLYDPSRPIRHRIEDALQRYQGKRRLENNRRAIFLKYLAYGGVDVSPRMFVGSDQKDLQELDSEQVLQAKTQSTIENDTAELTIDFDAVVRGYLTSYFPSYFNPETEDMVKLGTVTIRNFLSYLLYHDVCPEHKDNIDQARKSCDIATTELWKNQQFMAKGPGQFNKACSTLFGGYLYDFNLEGDLEGPWADGPPMTRSMAYRVVKLALVGAASDEVARKFRDIDLQGDVRAKRVEDIDGFEIMTVGPPNDDALDFYKEYAFDLIPAGKITAKAYWDPAKASYDMTAEESKARERDSPPIFKFFLEQTLLQLCYPGMKVITPVWKTNVGFHYFEETFNAYGTIYTVLANDLMMGWKKPKPIKDTADGDEMEADEIDAAGQDGEIADLEDIL
ncbi:uncharacterized protein BO97DRAFT_422953 [Aspergillus homomorphus CBS 101889]|uniref:Argonaute complex, subunit Arb1 n=1 Tax=Aspergillus homomorphus (strain CBS 101889) TaxID=1450537 RepID=A0A395I2X6_ASPHC|nr:hypothetical protein BO97DRAFT_422953 [Aspergillus homomorphus CBS 101889]RAL14039.1 hypothetical protein BO97DRAFT_422953 [Aspergillus homomorphus CBS 101889]